MYQLILIVHVLAAMGIIGLIMIQQGKGADMGASFGAGASQTLFGSSGSGNALTKATAILATLFFATSFGLAIVAKNKASSMGDVDIPVPAVVESRESAPVGDVPQSEGGMTPAEEGQDVPAAESGADVPGNGAAEESAGDIPQ